MYIMTKMVFSNQLKKRVVARYLELYKDKTPNPAVKVHSTHTECGKIVSFQFEEVAPENLGQKMAEYMKILQKFDDIEGLEYEIQATFTLEEGLKIYE